MIWGLTVWSFASILILIISGIITAVAGFSKKHDKNASILTITCMAIAFFFVLLSIPDVLSGGVLSFQMNAWPAPFGITIVIDMLTLVLSLVITGIGLLATLFSYKYIKKRRAEFYALVCFLMAGLLGIVHTGDLFNLFVFFEISNVSSYALVAYYRKRRSVEAGIKYLILGTVASSMILLGIGLIYASFGTLNMADLALKLAGTTGTIVQIALGLLVSGFAFKCGLFPFHFWMPDAYQAAPSPVSAMLGGLSVSAGIYAILRLSVGIFGAPGTLLAAFLVLGSVSMITGAVLAIMQSDLKRMLAYSSISQMGYIVMSVGLGTTLGMVGGVFHIINHAIIKSLLFLCAGVIIFHAGTSNMYDIGKRVRFRPAMTYVFLIGVLALAGLPFFNGFASKWLIYLSTFEFSPLLTIFTIVVSVLTFAYGIKAFYLIFLSGGRSSLQPKIPYTMLVPLIILAAACIVIGIIPQFGTSISETISSGLNSVAYTGAVLG